MTCQVKIITAVSRNGGIGFKGKLPWSIPKELKWFQHATTFTQDTSKENAIIMGRFTFESLPKSWRPLQGRFNIVVSSTWPSEVVKTPRGNYHVVPSFEAAVQLAASTQNVESTWVCGGTSIYGAALLLPCSEIRLTRVHAAQTIEMDTFFPPIPVVDHGDGLAGHWAMKAVNSGPAFEVAGLSPTLGENGMTFDIVTLRAVPDQPPEEMKENMPLLENFLKQAVTLTPLFSNPSIVDRHSEELQYLDLVADCIRNGIRQEDRTGTGTYSLFGRSMRFSLRDQVFPLLTTKRVFWRGLATELLWFVKGDTNANHLSEKDIHIWDGNASRAFLDSRGLTDREEGDLGPVYGFQWRHFGAEYVNMHTDYTGQGVDQLASVIAMIKNDPESRRIILTAWNPAALDKMALPPCHMMAQFFVDSIKKELSCLLYQRSADMGLGVPFNIASYALLTRMIAQVCGLQAAEFCHVIGNCHVYFNHVEALKKQIQRVPRPFPLLKLNPKKTDIDAFCFEDFTLVQYTPHGKIDMEMAV